MTKRPGTMSDEERGLQAIRERRTATPAHGVEVHAPEDRTPVTEVLALADRMPDPEARDILRDVAAKIWNHTTNQELRHRAAIQRTEGAEIRAALDKHEADDEKTHRDITEALADIHGKSGQNGKLGELRRRVDALSSKAWWVMSAFVGGIGAAAVKLVMVVRAFDAVESQAAHNTARIDTLQAQVLTLQSALLARSHRFPPAEAPDSNRKDNGQ